MSLEFFWRIPMHGDGRNLSSSKIDRGDWGASSPSRIAPGPHGDQRAKFSYFDYQVQVAKAAELNGFTGALVPTGHSSEEPWVVSAALSQHTRHLRFLLAYQAAFLSPAYAAQMGASLQRISGGRLEWNIITGGKSDEQLAYGDSLPHDERYARTREFLEVIDKLWLGAPQSHDGARYTIEQGGLRKPLAGARKPQIYFSGSSDPAVEVAGQFADVYLVWAEPLDGLKEQIEKVRRAADARGRRIRFGVRIDIIARETEDKALAEIRRIYDSIDQDTIALMKQIGPKDSVGSARQLRLHGGDRKSFDDLFVGPNLWAGFGLARPGPACGLVGSHAQVAERIEELADIGLSTFILSGTPHLEETFRVGQEVLPLVSSSRSFGSVDQHIVAAE